MSRIEPGSSPSPQSVPLEDAPAPQAAGPASSSSPSHSIAVLDSAGYEPLFEPQTRFAKSSLAELDHLLSGGLFDRVTQEETNRALQVLQETRPQDFKKVLAQLDRSGKLEVFLNESTPETRDQFLELLWSKGQLQRKLAVPPSGNFNPPVPPEAFLADESLPEPLQQAIESSNREAWSQYNARYKDYQTRFSAAVQQTTTPEELRNLGAPVGHAAGARMSEADHAVQARVAEFMGRAKPGSLALNLSKEQGWIKQQVETLRLGTDKVGIKRETSEERPAFTWLREEVKSDGKSLLKVDAGLGSVALGKEGTLELEVTSARVAVDGDGSTVSGGACTPLPYVKACVDVELAGASPRDNPGTIQTSNFWEIPAELRQGTGWGALSAKRREDLQRSLWTPQEWSNRQNGRGE